MKVDPFFVILSFSVTLISQYFVHGVHRDFFRPMGPITQRRFKYAIIRSVIGGHALYNMYKPKKGILPVPIPVPIPLPIEWEQP